MITGTLGLIVRNSFSILKEGLVEEVPPVEIPEGCYGFRLARLKGGIFPGKFSYGGILEEYEHPEVIRQALKELNIGYRANFESGVLIIEAETVEKAEEKFRHLDRIYEERCERRDLDYTPLKKICIHTGEGKTLGPLV